MIWGEDKPKIITETTTINYNIGDENRLIIKRDYEFQKREGLERTSVMTGARKYKYKGDYSEFTLDVICPAGITTEEFSTHWAQIQYYLKEGAIVTFYPHADNSFNVSCYVTDLKPYYWKNSFMHDAYQVVFKSAAYKELNYSQTATPYADPTSCAFEGTLHVSLHCATTNSIIYYTTDGTNPTKDSNRYYSGTSLTFYGETTLKARAFSPNARWSEIMTESYILKIPE